MPSPPSTVVRTLPVLARLAIREAQRVDRARSSKDDASGLSEMVHREWGGDHPDLDDPGSRLHRPRVRRRDRRREDPDGNLGVVRRCHRVQLARWVTGRVREAERLSLYRKGSLTSHEAAAPGTSSSGNVPSMRRDDRRNDERGLSSGRGEEALDRSEPRPESVNPDDTQSDGTPAWAVVDWEILEGRTGTESSLVGEAPGSVPLQLVDEGLDRQPEAQPIHVPTRELEQDAARELRDAQERADRA